MKFEEKQNASTLVGEYIFSVAGSDWEDYIKDAKKSLSKSLKVPGFRAGHIPEKVIVEKISKDQIYQKAASIFAHKAYDHAKKNLSKYKVKPYNFLKIQTIYDVIRPDKCQVTFQFAMSPIVKLGDWKKLKVKFSEYKVKDSDVDKNIESLLKRNAIFKTVDNRPSKLGDTILISYQGKIDGKSFPGGSGKNYSLELGSNQFIPGFEEQLVGTKTGEKKEISVTFPSDYDAKNIAGKNAKFEVTIHEIKEKHPAVLSDQFVQSLKIKDVTTVEALKNSIKNELQEKHNKKTLDEFNEKIISSLLSSSEVKLPKTMIDDELNQILKVFDQQLKDHNINRQDYLKTLSQTEDQLLNQFRKDAETRLALGFIFREISAKNNISTTDKEIEDFFVLLAKQSNRPIEEVKQHINNLEEIRFRLTNDKVWKLLVSTLKE